jgi:hypothetical protein
LFQITHGRFIEQFCKGYMKRGTQAALAAISLSLRRALRLGLCIAHSLGQHLAQLRLGGTAVGDLANSTELNPSVIETPAGTLKFARIGWH